MKHVFFDLDGTLTDPREGIVRCIQHALTSLGREEPDPRSLEQFIGPPLSHTFRTLLGASDDALIESAIAAYRQRFASVGMFENQVHPDIPRCLEVLGQAGRLLYLVTVKPTTFARRILDHFSLGRHFHAVHGSDFTDRYTEKATFIRRALEAESLDPRQVVMVGDRSDDVLGARRNGVASIAVTWGYGSRAELDGAGPQWMVGSVSELLACLGA